MQLSVFLSLVKKLAAEKGLSEPFLVGGIPRDKVLGLLNEMEDLDITTGDPDIHELGRLLANKLGSNATYKVMPDLHSTIHVGPLKLDFSSNFIVPNVERIVGRVLSSMEQEVYSRDFTCNTLLLNLDLKTIEDPIETGIDDINEKILKTCLKPNITLGLDNKRVIRIIYLAAKLGFSVDGAIFDWVRKNPNSVSNVNPSYLKKKLDSSLEYNYDLSLKLIKELHLGSYLPLTIQQLSDMEKS